MENQRIRISRMLLKESLLNLLREKPLEKITIYEICAKAQVNRTTFYKYYGSQQDLLDEIEDDFFSSLENTLTEAHPDIAHILANAVNFIYSQKETSRAIINSIPDYVFASRLFGIQWVMDMINESFGSVTTPEENYIQLFYFQGVYAVIRSWLNGGCQESPSKISSLLSLMIKKLN